MTRQFLIGVQFLVTLEMAIGLDVGMETGDARVLRAEVCNREGCLRVHLPRPIVVGEDKDRDVGAFGQVNIPRHTHCVIGRFGAALNGVEAVANVCSAVDGNEGTEVLTVGTVQPDISRHVVDSIAGGRVAPVLGVEPGADLLSEKSAISLDFVPAVAKESGVPGQLPEHPRHSRERRQVASAETAFLLNVEVVIRLRVDAHIHVLSLFKVDGTVDVQRVVRGRASENGRETVVRVLRSVYGDHGAHRVARHAVHSDVCGDDVDTGQGCGEAA